MRVVTLPCIVKGFCLLCIIALWWKQGDVWFASSQLSKELERLELLKRQNLKRFIEATRTELQKVWDKCHYGEQQKREFAPAFTGEDVTC